jgi:GNAT superfamily N-acetyltransferase
MREIHKLGPGEEGCPDGDGVWRFVAEDDGRRVGAVTIAVEPTTTNPAWLGSLPPTELSAFGFDLPWEDGYVDIGLDLLSGAAESLRGTVPDQIRTRVNQSFHAFVERRRHLLDSYGLEVFQEKQGFRWADDGEEIGVPDRLDFVSVEEIGVEAYAAVMARCGEGTLDRNDRYYWNGCGADNWAAQMMVYLQPEDAPMWLVGRRGADHVGFVAVRSEEDWDSTIAHIGVIPSHRGQGYINDLLLAGTAAAQRAGIHGMLSDVDVLNRPMAEAMRRNGHVDDPDWHLWECRGPFHT